MQSSILLCPQPLSCFKFPLPFKSPNNPLSPLSPDAICSFSIVMSLLFPAPPYVSKKEIKRHCELLYQL